MSRRVLFLLTAVWQVIRFVLIFLGALLLLQGFPWSGERSVHWFLLLAAGGLVIPAALVIMAMGYGRGDAMLNLVRLGKLLELLPSFFLLGVELARRRFPAGADPFVYLIFSVGVPDLLFFLLLVSYRGGAGLHGSSPPDEGSPEVRRETARRSQ